MGIMAMSVPLPGQRIRSGYDGTEGLLVVDPP